jgi:hypothetical protein
VVEIAHDLERGISDDPDQLWGLSWRVPDTVKAHARLEAAGIDVTDVRDGRRPGSQVFTVRSRTEGVPTLVIGGIGRAGCRSPTAHAGHVASGAGHPAPPRARM